jgi:hypothetical protein
MDSRMDTACTMSLLCHRRLALHNPKIRHLPQLRQQENMNAYLNGIGKPFIHRSIFLLNVYIALFNTSSPDAWDSTNYVQFCQDMVGHNSVTEVAWNNVYSKIVRYRRDRAWRSKQDFFLVSLIYSSCRAHCVRSSHSRWPIAATLCSWILVSPDVFCDLKVQRLFKTLLFV